MNRITIAYQNGFDGTGPLLADVAWCADGKRKPLLAVMHGYSGTRGAVSQDIEVLAAQGAVAVAPDMRGRGTSAGVWDSGGFDVGDIYWALEFVCRQMPELRGEIDPDNWHVVGYSGGGGNAIACACRFPDTFRSATSFFGVPDYAWFYDAAYRRDCNRWMEEAIGRPSEQPARFAARNMVPAAFNAAKVKMRFFWDAQEFMCPIPAMEAWIAAYRSGGGCDVKVNVTKPGDAKRWIHNYRSGNKDLNAADELFMDAVLAKPDPAQLKLPTRGTLLVPGYLHTRHFTVILDESDCRGATMLKYEFPRTSKERAKIEFDREAWPNAKVIYHHGETNDTL